MFSTGDGFRNIYINIGGGAKIKVFPLHQMACHAVLF